MKYKIPLSKPYLTKRDFQELKKCYNSSWISSKSPWVEKFEKLFAKKVSQTKYAVSVNSGTSALFLALKSLGIGQGDEVILPAFTMIATINAVTWVGATPILVDSTSNKDWNISISEIKQKISKKTKAIIPVHIYGYPCDMTEIIKLSREHGLFVIEDAAESMGTIFQGKNCGSFGDLSCFSLYSNKIITTGNGGIVATNSSKLYHLIKQLSFFDFNTQLHFLHNKIGYNLVLSGIQASLGVSQIGKFKQLLNKRREIYRWYYRFLNKNKNITFINPDRKDNPNYWFPTVIFNKPEVKKKALFILEKKGVETREFFLPLHRQPVYADIFKNQLYPFADYFHGRGILLPSYFDLKVSEVKYISKLINSL